MIPVPRLSVIMPCFNASKTIREAVESILNQNLTTTYEIILVDDCSTDNTKEIMEELKAGNKELIQLYFHDKNKGGGATRNTAVKNSTGELIFCLDSDDILPSQQLNNLIKYFDSVDCEGVLFEETRFFTKNPGVQEQVVKNRIPSSYVELKEMFDRNAGFLARVNFLYTRKSYDLINGYPENHGFDTQAFGFKFLGIGLHAIICPSSYYYHRRGESPSYFDRENLSGKISSNMYYICGEIFHLFSPMIKSIVSDFKIYKHSKSGGKNLESTLGRQYETLGEDKFFIHKYKDFMKPNGKDEFYLSHPDATRFTLPNKKIIFLMHNGGRLGNQLWTIAALYAYSLEKSYKFDLRCFFEYQEYFNIQIESKLSKFLGIMYLKLERFIPENILRDLFYGPYTFYTEVLAFIFKNDVVYDWVNRNQQTFRIFIYKRVKTLTRLIANTISRITNIPRKEGPQYFEKKNPNLGLLPPSIETDSLSHKNKVYFYGWIFRNPVGIVKYQRQIKNFLTPKKYIVDKIDKQISELRAKFDHVVGVHIRLGDVVNEYMDKDRVAYNENEILPILKGYLKEFGLDPLKTAFMVCSDGKINLDKFPGLNMKISKNHHIEDLWLLSQTDTIIGADSSFAITASLLGNKRFIVFSRSEIDWQYYKDNDGYFENKYVKRFVY